MGIKNLIRKEQTTLEFDRLREEVADWHGRRAAEDKLDQYKTQLAAIKTLLDEAAKVLKDQLDLLNLNLAAGDFYEECRLFDLRVLWLRKVWNFYREKFDQRDDKFLRPILKAADEVVWSCFNQVFISDSRKRPAPLPFIEASYSPASFPSELVPYDLKPDENGFLKDLMSRLPVPFVSLPQSCVNAPWWLVYVGHEIGHQIQYALLDQKKLVTLFQNRLKEIIKQATGDEKYADEWSFWGQEIFADVFSVLMMGEWAIWAMVEFELQKPERMPKRRRQYPSPVVRLKLLEAIAGKLKLDGRTALRQLDLTQTGAGAADVERDLQHIPAIVEMSFETLPGLPETLATLADFRLPEFQTGGYVPNWAQVLSNENAVGAVGAINGDLRSPRLAVCAALAAWAELNDADDATRAERRRHLAANTIDLIVKSRDGESREAAVEKEELGGGFELSQMLLNADKNTLEF